MKHIVTDEIFATRRLKQVDFIVSANGRKMTTKSVRLAFSMFELPTGTGKCRLVDKKRVDRCFLSDSADIVIRALRLK